MYSSWFMEPRLGSWLDVDRVTSLEFFILYNLQYWYENIEVFNGDFGESLMGRA